MCEYIWIFVYKVTECMHVEGVTFGGVHHGSDTDEQD